MKGSITKRGENSWLIRVYDGINPSTGKKKYIQETFRGTDKEAETRLHEIITDKNRGEYVEPNKTTFYEFLVNTWLPAVKVNATSGTYREYKSIVEVHISKEPIARIPLSKLELQHIENYKIKKLNSERLDTRKPGKISPKTVKNHMIAIKRALAYACELKILKYNPAQYAKFPYVPKYKPRTLTEEESQKFLDYAFFDRFYFLFVLAIFYSKRQGELRGLRKQDVDLKALTASIRQSVSGSGYKAEFKDTKNADASHVLELEPWMVPFFEREFKKRAEEKLLFGKNYNDNDLVFASINGNPVKERTLTKHYKKILQKAGLPDIRFHDLRHTCITIILKRGWSLKHAQARAAHASIKTTGDTYGHVTPEMQRELNKDLAKALKIKVIEN